MRYDDRNGRSGPLAIGLLLIALGVAFLLAQWAGFEVGRYGWPYIVIGAGVVVFVAGFLIGEPAGVGLAVFGGIVAATGTLLLAQAISGLWASWAYAWALIAPGSVGLALLVYGFVFGRRDLVRGGMGALSVGVVLFLVGALFFEGILDISDLRGSTLGGLILPAAVIALGVLVLIGAFMPRRWWRDDLWNGERWRGGRWGSDWPHGGSGTPGGPATPGAPGQPTASMAPGEPPSASGPEHPAPGLGATPGSGAPSTPGWTAGPASVPALAVDLAGASNAEVAIRFGAGRLRIGPAAAGRLVEGTFEGGVVPQPGGPGAIRLSMDASTWGSLGTWTGGRTWQVGVTAEVPLRLSVETGAAEAELDLTETRLAALSLRTGASETRVRLPRAAGATWVQAEGGATTIRFRVPEGVAARVRSTVALGDTRVDERRFPRTLDGWMSPDFGTAANRVEIELRGGVGSFSVE